MLGIWCSFHLFFEISDRSEQILLTEFSKSRDTAPMPFSLCFRTPRCLWKYVNEGLFVSTVANIATCSHWWLPLLNSTTILETPVWKHSNPTCPHWASSVISTQSCLKSIHWGSLLLKNRTGSVAFCRLVAKSGHSGAMARTLVLESGKLGSNSDPVRPLSLGVNPS